MQVSHRTSAASVSFDEPNLVSLAGGEEVSVTVRMDPAVKRAIATIPATAWKTIEYTDAVYDETTSTWVSKAEVAEIGFTAFSSRKETEQVTGRLVVRRIPELNKKADGGQAHLPSGVFAANSAWLVAAVMAYNLTRTVGLLASGPFSKARTGTIRRKLIHVPARIATSARKPRLHLPQAWPWQTHWEKLNTSIHPPPTAA